MQIYLVRHTAIDVPKGICYGQSDVPVLHTFQEEARAVRAKLPAETDAVYTSPLTRCRRLAGFLDYPTAIQEDSRLKEMNFGAWEMKAWDEIDAPSLSYWMQNYETVSCPDGESYPDVVHRARTFLHDLSEQRYASAVIVTHGGVIKSMHHILKSLSLTDAMSIRIPYGEVFTFVI